MDGKPFLTELKELVKEDETSQEEVNRYLLVGMIGISDSISELSGKMDDLQTQNTESTKLLTDLGKQVEGIGGELVELGVSVKKNPAFIVGEYFKGGGKRFVLAVSTLFALMNLWFISEIRRSILLFLVPLGFPKEWVDYLTTGE